MKKSKRTFKKIFPNKKGIGAEVDWVIAIGVFLIYLALTLVFFKPGIKPVYNSDTLLEIVDENFRNSAYWTITTQPMFVEPINFQKTCGSGTSAQTINDASLKYVPKPLGGGEDTCKYPNTGTGNSVQVEFRGKLTNGAVTSGFPIFTGTNPYKKENLKLFFVAGNIAQENIVGSGSRAETSEAGQKTGLERAMRRMEEPLNRIPSSVCLAISWTQTTPIDTVIIPNIKNCCEPFIANTNLDGDTSTNRDAARNLEKCNDALGLVNQYEALSAPPTVPNAPDTEIVDRDSLTTSPAELREGFVDDFSINNDNLVFTPYFNAVDKTKYILTYANDVINVADTTSLDITAPTRVIYDIGCSIDNYNSDYTPNQACHARYELGVAETFSGLSLRKLLLYKDFPCPGSTTKSGYECIKENWGYPANKDFKIRIYKTNSQTPIAEFPKQTIIPSNVDVYSKQFSTFILNEDGLRQAVTVNILVW